MNARTAIDRLIESPEFMIPMDPVAPPESGFELTNIYFAVYDRKRKAQKWYFKFEAKVGHAHWAYRKGAVKGELTGLWSEERRPAITHRGPNMYAPVQTISANSLEKWLAKINGYPTLLRIYSEEIKPKLAEWAKKERRGLGPRPKYMEPNHGDDALPVSVGDAKLIQADWAEEQIMKLLKPFRFIQAELQHGVEAWNSQRGYRNFLRPHGPPRGEMWRDAIGKATTVKFNSFIASQFRPGDVLYKIKSGWREYLALFSPDEEVVFQAALTNSARSKVDRLLGGDDE